jgi:predicted regulator of Ras-like GTPase activity (Roadblock/LC7/MglB family)
MAISVKSKFAGFLRGLVGRTEAPARSAAPAPPTPASAQTPRVTSQNSVPARAPQTPHGGNPDEIELPLASVVASLPLDLRAKLASAPGNQTIRLQAELVIGQLAFGAVKISFGELRNLAPGAFVNSGGELDNKLVSLPLQEILPRLNPALLARRSAKKIEVAEEIVGPFAGRGRGFSFTTQPLKSPAAPPPPPADPEPEPEPEPVRPISFTPPAQARQVSPPPVTPQFPQRSVTPAAPTNGTHGTLHGNPPLSPMSPPSRTVTPAPSIGNGNNYSNGNGNGNGHSNGNGHGLTLPPGLKLGSMNGNHQADAAPLKMSPMPQPAPAASSPAPTEPAVPQPTIFASLNDLCQSWPEEIKEEILRSPLAQANVPLDGGIILPGLKRGRVTMTWRQIRILAQPSSAVSPKDNVELELPLRIIAPLFLAAQKGSAKSQTKASVSAEIPDLFFGFPQPAAAPVAPVVPVIPPLPKPVESKPQDTNYFLKPADNKATDTNYFARGDKAEAAQTEDTSLRRADAPQTDFMSRQAHPKEVVQRAVALPGVAGSVVAMQDGLRVASQTPAELNPDTLAAFLPQIFERVNQSTRELRMGALNNVNFTVGNVPWKIFRVNSVYFAAFGRAGEQLPSGQLAQLAAELDRKK